MELWPLANACAKVLEEWWTEAAESARGDEGGYRKPAEREWTFLPKRNSVAESSVKREATS